MEMESGSVFSFRHILIENIPGTFEIVGISNKRENVSQDYVNTTYRQRWIERICLVSWPVRYADLTSLAFMLADAKNQIFANRPSKRKGMITRMKSTCSVILTKFLLKSVQNYRRRYNFDQFLRELNKIVDFLQKWDARVVSVFEFHFNNNMVFSYPQMHSLKLSKMIILWIDWNNNTFWNLVSQFKGNITM